MFNGHINGRLNRLERACPTTRRNRRQERCPLCAEMDRETGKGNISFRVMLLRTPDPPESPAPPESPEPSAPSDSDERPRYWCICPHCDRSFLGTLVGGIGDRWMIEDAVFDRAEIERVMQLPKERTIRTYDGVPIYVTEDTKPED